MREHFFDPRSQKNRRIQYQQYWLRAAILMIPHINSRSSCHLQKSRSFSVKRIGKMQKISSFSVHLDESSSLLNKNFKSACADPKFAVKKIKRIGKLGLCDSYKNDLCQQQLVEEVPNQQIQHSQNFKINFEKTENPKQIEKRTSSIGNKDEAKEIPIIQMQNLPIPEEIEGFLSSNFLPPVQEHEPIKEQLSTNQYQIAVHLVESDNQIVDETLLDQPSRLNVLGLKKAHSKSNRSSENYQRKISKNKVLEMGKMGNVVEKKERKKSNQLIRQAIISKKNRGHNSFLDSNTLRYPKEAEIDNISSPHSSRSSQRATIQKAKPKLSLLSEKSHIVFKSHPFLNKKSKEKRVSHLSRQSGQSGQARQSRFVDVSKIKRKKYAQNKISKSKQNTNNYSIRKPSQIQKVSLNAMTKSNLLKAAV